MSLETTEYKMNIDTAIKMLQDEKEAGTKSIVMAYWTARAFQVQDDEAWEECASAGDDIDWSGAHEDIQYAIDDNVQMGADPLTPIED